jgi:hypothetical protein
VTEQRAHAELLDFDIDAAADPIHREAIGASVKPVGQVCHLQFGADPGAFGDCIPWSDFHTGGWIAPALLAPFFGSDGSESARSSVTLPSGFR